MSAQQQWHRMNGEQLASQAKDIWREVSKHASGSNTQTELEQVTQELAGRIEFVTQGKTPQPTHYSSLDATALAHQTRAVVGRIGRELPIEQREQLDVLNALADRIEYAGAGMPGMSGSFSTSR